MRVLLCLLCITACGGRLADDNVSPADAADEATLPISPFAAGQHWKGTYTCAQGLTNLDLQIVSTHAEVPAHVVDDALFVFDWSGGVSGSYHLSGTFEPTTHHATFIPGAWVAQPQGWYT